MMGGGLCWLDYNNDGWMDLFVVNSYSDETSTHWNATGGLPRSALFENVHGRFVGRERQLARRTSRCRGTAASPPTSTATATPTS